MVRPTLTVVAGCNGSGKSSFSHALTPTNVFPFDYDKEYLSIYNSLKDSELRDQIAHHKARKLLENRVANSIKEAKSFTYETNFNSTPLFWPNRFKESNFRLRLFYFCLNSIEEAIRRVQIRVENGGHFVPNDEVKKRYFEGFENLNRHWTFFDQVFLFETSAYKKEPHHFLSIIDSKVSIEDQVPTYLKKLIPSILSQK